MASAQQAQLFDAAPQLPEGFIYQRDFLTAEEEAALLTEIRALPLAEAKYKEYTARRRTASFGGQYDYTLHKLEAAPTFPEFLLRLREKVGGWVGIPAEKFVHGLVSEYRPGTPLGWHRDVPNFETIVGISLAGNARMRLRPYRPGEKQRREDVIALELEPRSAYIIRGSARWGWQHSVSPTKELRYSITLRTAHGNA